jgi:peptidoglycan/xylan/chitin deacetylase (PgdA/CDA1 family)
MSRRSFGFAAGAAAGVAAAYWTFMSPYAQLIGHFPYRSRTERPVVALTFDDGPNEPYTSQIADYLGGKGIRATFFQVGRAVRAHPDVTARLARAGHVIGHHSDTHQFTRYLHRDSLREELAAGLTTFAEVGLHPALYRPPWLLRIPALFPLLREHGLQPVSGAFCHPLEVLQPSGRRIARGALARARPGAIVIFHDGFDGHPGNRAETVHAVRIVVETLERRGYGFATVDDLLGVPAYNHPGRSGGALLRWPRPTNTGRVLRPVGHAVADRFRHHRPTALWRT